MCCEHLNTTKPQVFIVISHIYIGKEIKHESSVKYIAVLSLNKLKSCDPIMIRWVVNSIARDLYGNASRPHSVEGRRTLNSETRWEWLRWQAAGPSCGQCLGPQVSRVRLTGHTGHGVQEVDGHPAWSLKLESTWVNTLESWVRKPEAGPWVRSWLVPLSSDPEKLPPEHTLSLPLLSWTWAEAVNQGGCAWGKWKPRFSGSNRHKLWADVN